MKITDVMTDKIQLARTDTSLVEAAKLMNEREVGVIPVVSGRNELVGMLTDRDITVRSVAQGHDPKEITVKAAMTENVVSCFTDQTTDDVARLMQDKKLRRVIVVDRANGAVTGIVSLGDIAKVSGAEELAGKTLGRVCE